MKKIAVLFFGLLANAGLFAQSAEQPHAISAKVLAHDYVSLDESHKMRTDRFLAPQDWTFGGELAYRYYLNPSFNLSAGLRLGAIDAYHEDSRILCISTPCEKRNHPNELGVGLDLQAHYKFANGYILSEEAAVQPYILAGLAPVYMTEREDNPLDLQIPLGVGAKIPLNDKISLELQAEYRASLITQKSNFALGLGAVFQLGKKEKKAIPPPPPPKDSDGDGITDEQDDCPQTAGLAEFNGCPDTDGDGIPDQEDDCPEQAGLAEFKGCPDTDGDGIPDKEDNCPEEAGPKENQGCPEIKKADQDILDRAMKEVHFETGKAILLPSSKEILKEMANLLKRYPEHQLKIQGHTDNLGGTSNNLILSRERAKACYDFLIQEGVSASRLSHKGFGETQPLVSNNTKEGRAKNRRVEFILFK
ncbi:outer membrane protein/peptidoglycan-associated (lipo)protein [Saprospira grandis DSM 2844]|uniref:Outer membrane protein/peptidoglycan-associated (Lipo)protein n=1 Tax=Saprospira grandis DSM 2844 TaxID=694433 RepID=J0P375_9BACT|nr:OmpA family protein [Saprospira grandis]EJF51867.1 outer membrane protein/peptidoglycan-associated (lipo)protein [Saprospira grandis DSM 2844]